LSSKNTYITFCKNNEQSIPLFFQPYWLDVVCADGHWDVVASDNNNDQASGFIVYYSTKKYGQSIVTMPPITPFSGLLLHNTADQKKVSFNKWETTMMRSLLQQLPKYYTYFNQCFHYTHQNWLPFYWADFQQTTRYSYVIEDLSAWSIEDTATNIRNKISKASKQLTIHEVQEVAEVYKMVGKVFGHKSVGLVLRLEMLEAVDLALAARNKRSIFVAVDEQQVVHGAIYVVYDHQSAYNLLLGSDPQYRQSGAVPLLLHHAIQHARSRVKSFDFEGSMLASLHDLFVGFGGVRKAYMRVFKTKNTFWDIIYRLKSRYDKSNR
jgi:ribosomal protein S18 acetylase RimI-like enzyme